MPRVFPRIIPGSSRSCSTWHKFGCHRCHRVPCVFEVGVSYEREQFMGFRPVLRFFKTVLPCDMRNLSKSPSKQQIKNRKHTFKENLVKLSTTALCFFFGPNFDLFPLKVHLYVDRPRPWLHELGSTYIFPKLLVTCQVACRSMQICRACSPEPSWPCTSVLGYVWVQSLEKKHVLNYFFCVYIICFFSFTLSRSNLRFQWWPSLRQCLDGALPSEWRCETSNEATATRHFGWRLRKSMVSRCLLMFEWRIPITWWWSTVYLTLGSWV